MSLNNQNYEKYKEEQKRKFQSFGESHFFVCFLAAGVFVHYLGS